MRVRPLGQAQDLANAMRHTESEELASVEPLHKAGKSIARNVGGDEHGPMALQEHVVAVVVREAAVI